MSRRVSEIAVRFRKLPHWIFDETRQIRGNLLAIRLQPDEGIDLRVTIKEPGPGGMRLVEVSPGHEFCRNTHIRGNRTHQCL